MKRSFVPSLLGFLVLMTTACNWSRATVLCHYGQARARRYRVELRRLYLTLDVNTTNNNCNVKSMLFMDRNEPQYRETVSIALLSFAQGRAIDVYHDGSCVGDTVKLFAVSIHTIP